MSFTPAKLTVTNPCLEDWNLMEALENGRHCNRCQKTVIDFSLLSDNEIRAYFLNNAAVCGRFHKKQLERIRVYIPVYILKKRIPVWKKFLLIFLICFGANLYPFDIIVDTKKGLYAQSTSRKQVATINTNLSRKAKSLKLKKTDQNFLSSFNEIGNFILGFTRVIQLSTTIPIKEPIHRIIYSAPDKALPASLSQSKANESDKHEQPPADPLPENSQDYILPQQLNYRRRRR